MDQIAQQAALDPEQLGGGDQAQFWREPRHDGMECLKATFRQHRYAPHSHETYVVGVIVAGCEAFHIRGERQYARAGQVCFVNPGEVHDGEPAFDQYAYRMSYPSTDLMRAMAEEVFDRPLLAAPSFRQPLEDDPDLWSMFLQAHSSMERAGGALERDERLLRVIGVMLQRYADISHPVAQAGRAVKPMENVKAYIDAHYTDDLGLDELAQVAGLSRHYLIGTFKQTVGLTPHAYLIDRRVRAACDALRSGLAPADVAASCGFFDQSHLTRAFKARLGVTPGAYRAA